MPNAATCLDCMEAGPVVAVSRWERVGEPFASRYAADHCAGSCGRPIVPGARIQRFDRTDGSLTVYVHDGCNP